MKYNVYLLIWALAAAFVTIVVVRAAVALDQSGLIPSIAADTTQPRDAFGGGQGEFPYEAP